MNEEIQYLAEAIGANSQEDFQQKLASMGIKSQEQLKELLKAIKIAKQQGIKANQFVTWLQQQTQKAQKGAKLNYLKTLYNGCPDGYVKYKDYVKLYEKDKVGEQHVTNEGYKIKIVAPGTKKNYVVIEFEKPQLYRTEVQYSTVKLGTIRNVYKKTVSLNCQ